MHYMRVISERVFVNGKDELHAVFVCSEFREERQMVGAIAGCVCGFGMRVVLAHCAHTVKSDCSISYCFFSSPLTCAL